jgi:hypothetical protein
MGLMCPGSVGAFVLSLVAATLVAACASKPLTSRSDAEGGTEVGGATNVGGSTAAGSSGSPFSHSGSAGTFGASCELGTERCDCRLGGDCDRGLTCLSNLCVNAEGLCPYADDGFCDEPNICPPGTDPDCCADLKNGVCEEMDSGGTCPTGSDWHDCGYCPASLSNDGFCDEPDVCPSGTDNDCCATRKDGVCEEQSKGGDCLDGSDSYDCGYCPEGWAADGICDEPADCPEGSDGADCCANFGDGVCDEMSAGGRCTANSDWFDCGYCFPGWVGDGFCDEVQQGGSCPHNTDPEDCCATWDDDICEEPSAEGECPAFSDFLDCGYCPPEWISDGYCDEIELGGSCPAGTDSQDCCGTPHNGMCEEKSMGGECEENSDWYDCGYCPDFWLHDDYCIENEQPWGCPAGSDSDDCAL